MVKGNESNNYPLLVKYRVLFKTNIRLYYFFFDFFFKENFTFQQWYSIRTNKKKFKCSLCQYTVLCIKINDYG